MSATEHRTAVNVDEHDRLYQAAAQLLERVRIFTAASRGVGWFARRRVRKAIALLQQVVALNPGNWAALWMTGKAYQALRDHQAALACFTKSRLLNADHPDIAREAGISAMECQRLELAIEFTEAALLLKPGDHGLLANLALARLFAGEASVARELLDTSLQSDPDDRITLRISKVVDDVLANRRKCPRKRSEV